MVGVKRLLAQSSPSTIVALAAADSFLYAQTSSHSSMGRRNPQPSTSARATSGASSLTVPVERVRPPHRGGRVVKDYFFLLLWSPGASSLAFAAPVSCLMSPGAFPDFPGSSDPLGTGWWPGEFADTPLFGEPLPAAWTSCEVAMAATSAAAHITIFLRAM